LIEINMHASQKAQPDVWSMHRSGMHPSGHGDRRSRPIISEETAMTNLTHWNPFKSLTRLHSSADLENYLRGFRSPSVWANFETSAPDIRLDINEDDKAYRVKAEIPGVDKKDIDVSVEGNQVSISAEVKRESNKKEGEKEVCSERYYGQVYRAFALPADVDGNKVEARYENGVLTMTLPKKSNGQSHKIAVG
jgi:HSP20 family protein